MAVTSGASPTKNEVGSPAAAVPGSSVTPEASLLPLPSASNERFPWLEIVWPPVPALTVAVMVMVTEPPSGASEPSQVTVFVPTVATAVPEVAVALTRVRPAGRTSVNS